MIGPVTVAELDCKHVHPVMHEGCCRETAAIRKSSCAKYPCHAEKLHPLIAGTHGRHSAARNRRIARLSCERYGIRADRQCALLVVIYIGKPIHVFSLG
jgi:hypothetical protein